MQKFHVMSFRKSFLLTFLFSIPALIIVKAQNPADFVADFNAIGSKPVEICFSNKFKVNNKGGHLQGIQRYENKNGEYFFLSGSSEKESYYAVLKTTPENKLIQINNFFEKPFKHAGGFQIFGNYLAVGIEDNDKKDKSKVCIFDISNPEEKFGAPKLVIERNGEPLRSTAGCVGITKLNGKYLVAVGDWDTKHIDFYWTQPENTKEKPPVKTGSIAIEETTKTDWINNEWNSYQNINLFNVNGILYLIGLGQNSKSENIADLYEVLVVEQSDFKLKKTATRKFNCSGECSFKAGAGVEYINGKLTIFACGYNIGKVSEINIFGNKPNQQK